MEGIIYLIQPAELLNTDRYKIGMSNKRGLDRVKKGYKKGTKWISINEVDNPSDVEKTMKKIFTEKFTLIAGKEYFEGKIKDIYYEYSLIILKHISNNKSNVIIDKTINFKTTNKSANIIQKWWIKLMLKYYNNIYTVSSEFDTFTDEVWNRYNKLLYKYEYDEIIDTYEKYIKYLKYRKGDHVDDIIIINKVNKIGFIKFSNKNYYYIFGDNIDESLYGWINANKYDHFIFNNKLKKCKFCINELIEDIVKKCYKRNIKFYKNKTYEYILSGINGQLYEYNYNTKKLSNIDLKENEILIEYQKISIINYNNDLILTIDDKILSYYKKEQVSIDKKIYHIEKFRNLNF